MLATKYPVDNVFFFSLIPYPGTELFEWVKQNNYFLYPPEHYLNRIHSNMDEPVFATPELSAGIRKRMLRLAKRSVRRSKVKVYIEKMNKMGVKGLLAKIIANIYTIGFIQRIFNDIKFLQNLKARILKI